MAEFQENSSKLFSFSSSENRDSIESSNTGRDEEFYEKIEAPKFVDFTAPDHYHPDDRYWFCLRVGCEQKHEKEMDSEEIYRNFVLRVMAARSPNVRLGKALERNASRTPMKCSLSAPPKSNKPRLSRMAIISSISKKMIDDKKKVVRPLLKSGSTPVTRTKPVAAKYLTTPRNKKCTANQSSFRSVQNPKPVNVEVPKSRMVAKALVFHSPKKSIKVKTSVELRTPVSKLCEGMNKLEITSQRKLASGCSSKSLKHLSNDSSKRQLKSGKVKGRSEKLLYSQTPTNQEAKSGRSIKGKTRGKLPRQQPLKKLLENDRTDSSKKNEGDAIEEQLAKKVVEELEPQKSTYEEACMSSNADSFTHKSDLASPDESKREESCLDLEGSDDKLISPATKRKNSNDHNENSSTGLISESCAESKDHLIVNNSSGAERYRHEFADGDDKENAAASDENRMPKYGQVRKTVTQVQDKNLKEGIISSGPVMKLKKPKATNPRPFRLRTDVTQVQDNLKDGIISSAPMMKLKKPKATNPKPFRLRTDERGNLKESNLERKTNSLTPQNESVNLSTSDGKLQRKQPSDIQKRSVLVGLKTPKGGERTKAALSVTPESNKSKHHQKKPMNSPIESSAIQRLEKFRKIISSSPLQKRPPVRPQGPLSTKKEQTSYLIPGQKLDVIHETSPEVSELRRLEKPTVNAPLTDDGSRSSSRGRRPVTVATEPNFHSMHVPRSCIKKLK